MLRTLVLPVIAGLTVTALAAVPAAEAHTIIDAFHYNVGSGGQAGFESCTNAPDPGPSYNDEMTPGAASTRTNTESGTLTRNSDNTDVITYSASTTGTAKYTLDGGEPASVSMQGTGSIDVDGTKPTSGCGITLEAATELNFTLEVTSDLILDARVEVRGVEAFAEFRIGQSGEGSVLIGGDATAMTSSTRVLLPAGIYTGLATIGVDHYQASASSDIAGTSRMSSMAVFHTPGQRLSKVKGSGRQYVALPGARSCAGGKVLSRVTPNKAKAAQIDVVEYFVEGKRVAVVKDPKPGKRASLKANPKQDVAVLALVRLANGKTRKARTDYIACAV